MKTHFLIVYVIDNPEKLFKSAIIGIDIKNPDGLFEEDLVELAFKKVEQKYPNNELTLLDYKRIDYDIEFIDV